MRSESGYGNGPGPTPQAMATLWSVMISWFGQLWTTTRGRTPDEAWKFGLEGLSDDEVAAGLKAMRETWGDKFPPSLPEFRAMCRPDRSGPSVEDMSDVELVDLAQRLNVPSAGLSRKALERAVKAMGRRGTMRSVATVAGSGAVLKEEEND